MSSISGEEIVRILEDCTDPSCQEHQTEVHIFNLLRWGMTMVRAFKEKASQLFHGIQLWFLGKLLSTQVGETAAKQKVIQTVRARYNV
ncbi:C (U1) putative protein [Sandjimba virus]|uniref:Uncharacterized protein n=1 Tax=Sandjimba virus TaxID=380432 RepID=A0AAE8XFU2_9RHAB|nr:C (U1) putative protein [Sandjimba virus]UAU42853.1 C (U1) putative protein [Sandjimba virus]